MKDLFYFTLSMCLLFLLWNYSEAEQKKTESKSLKIQSLNLSIKKQKDSIIWLSNELRKHESHIYRMQRIAGIKNPDSVFTWKEKVLHPVNTYNLIHKKDPD